MRTFVRYVAMVWLGLVGCSDSDADGDDGTSVDSGVDAAVTPERPQRSIVEMPLGMAGIGFDDLQFSKTLDRLLVPAGRAGYVGLVDPATEQVEPLGELSTADTYDGGHDFGSTSAIEAEGLVYALDRTAMTLNQLDPASGGALAAIGLGGAPDYVRYVASTRELWVTEPEASRFEIFTLSDADPPVVEWSANMVIAGGPESMVVDPTGETAYTNTFLGETMRVDIASRTETARWDNGCSISLGLALDSANSRLFVGCTTEAVTIDLDSGSVLSTLDVSGGVDIIAYNAELQHLYLNGSAMGQLTVASVAADGTLALLAMEDTAPSSNSSCVASDPYDNIWVCNANAGELFRFTDVY